VTDTAIIAAGTASLVLRPYQSDCILAVRSNYARGHRALLLTLPTGAGKTVVFASITAKARDKGKRVLVVVSNAQDVFS
jgi:DNA repair protein RadD